MKKILVIGESCKDMFVYCHAERLAPDLPVPVLRVIEETSNPGMAKNVERNIAAIYPHVELATNDNWERITKTRYVHQNTNHTFIRIDSEPSVPRLDRATLDLSGYDMVAVSDYNKGFLTEDDIQAICESHPNVFIDSKKILGSWASQAKIIKINNFEHERSKHALTPELADKIIVTYGGQGAQFQGKQYSVEKVEVQDSTGAGDSFFAGLLVGYAETGDIERAIRFANAVASRVVQQKGVNIIERPDESLYAKKEE